MSRIYLGLGTNLGEKKKNLEHALRLLSERVAVKKVSSFYETEPVGYKDQPWFLNIVIEGETSLKPFELLNFTQGIEKEMKRVKTIVNGPRIIDVDILLYDEIEMKSETLIIPHPRMKERAFVMVPLFEICPDIIIMNEKIDDIMKNFKGEKIFKKD
jgi:2-amino-4-hydroxy-6-hydroxymethyldihydropteridine diphosphokinase